MENCAVKLVIFNNEDFDYYKNQIRNYLLSHGHAIWQIMQEVYMIPATLDNMTQGEQQRNKNNYNALNLITTALDRNVYDRVSYLETTYGVCIKLCNTYESYYEIKSSCKDTYNMQY
jgi:type II secretory pathway pseudopilin PulG